MSIFVCLCSSCSAAERLLRFYFTFIVSAYDFFSAKSFHVYKIQTKKKGIFSSSKIISDGMDEEDRSISKKKIYTKKSPRRGKKWNKMQFIGGMTRNKNDFQFLYLRHTYTRASSFPRFLYMNLFYDNN